MRVFHRTTSDAAADIRIMGFHDSTGSYMTDGECTGVWVSDVPLEVNDGARGDTLLTLKTPADLFARYEWVEHETAKRYREALIPAVLLNQCGQPRLVSSEAEAIWQMRRLAASGIGAAMFPMFTAQKKGKRIVTLYHSDRGPA